MTIDHDEHWVIFAGCALRLMASEYENSTKAGQVLIYGHLLRRIRGEENNGEMCPIRTSVNHVPHRLSDDSDKPTCICSDPHAGNQRDEA